MQLVDLRLERVHGERQRVHEVVMHVHELLGGLPGGLPRVGVAPLGRARPLHGVAHGAGAAEHGGDALRQDPAVLHVEDGARRGTTARGAIF